MKRNSINFDLSESREILIGLAQDSMDYERDLRNRQRILTAMTSNPVARETVEMLYRTRMTEFEDSDEYEPGSSMYNEGYDEDDYEWDEDVD